MLLTFELAKAALRQGFNGRLLCCSGFLSPKFVRRALALEVSGYIIKAQDVDLADGVRAVAQGKRVFCQQVADMASVLHEDPERRPAGLSKMEVVVFREAAAGASRREAAKKLKVAPTTVEIHLARALRKLGVRLLPPKYGPRDDK